jgi:hypothetical protein
MDRGAVNNDTDGDEEKVHDIVRPKDIELVPIDPETAKESDTDDVREGLGDWDGESDGVPTLSVGDRVCEMLLESLDENDKASVGVGLDDNGFDAETERENATGEMESLRDSLCCWLSDSVSAATLPPQIRALHKTMWNIIYLK